MGLFQCDTCQADIRDAESLKRAMELLREWRDKHGGKEHYAFRSYHSPDVIATVSQTELLRETQRFLEGK